MNARTVEEEKYVNGCRLSSSLLELQPFKVVTAEAKPMTEERAEAKKHSYSNNNNHYKDKQTNPTPSSQNDSGETKPIAKESHKMSLLTPNANQNANATSLSCGNLFENPALRVKNIPSSETNKSMNFGSRAASAGFESVGQGNSLPKQPIMRSNSKDKLLGDAHDPIRDTPRHHSESKKAPPIKPNRESLRRSKQDIRASHPNLQTSANRSSMPRSGQDGISRNNSDRKPTTLPFHDYEELPADVRILQQRKISQSQADNSQVHAPTEQGFKPIAFQSPTSPAVPDRPRHPRQRQNPLYAAMHVNPYDAGATNGGVIEKRAPTRCLRCLVAGVILAVMFSLLSIIASALLILGYLKPLEGFLVRDSSESNMTAQLQAASIRLSSQEDMIAQLGNELVNLKNQTNLTAKMTEDRLQTSKTELLDAVKALNISALQGPSTADVSRCIHNSFGIGSSSSQEETDSGEYFPEEGYVTTGVTCSSSPGYVAYLYTREEEVDWDESTDVEEPLPRVIYRCKCRKSRFLGNPSSSRVECRIHYWQCPML